MSSIALTETPAVRAVRKAPGRLALLFAVIAVTSVSAFALSLVSFVRPIGDGDTLPGFAAIESMRGYVWTFFVVAGIQLVVGVCAIAVAGWILSPVRGARWATVGGSLMWLGAAVYGVGIGGWATAYYFADGTALVDRMNDDTLHMLAVPIGGAAMVAVGSLALAVGLWRAGTVPRWVVVVGALSSVATLALPPSSAAGLVAEAASSASGIAIGWYAWRRYTRGA